MGSRMCLVGLPPGIILTASFIFFSLTDDGFKPKEKKSVIKSSNGQYLKKDKIAKKNIKTKFEKNQTFCIVEQKVSSTKTWDEELNCVSPALTQ